MTARPQRASTLDFEHAYHQYNRVQNDDPTNEYMYQMPLGGNNGDHQDMTKGDGDGDTYTTNVSAPLDLEALHQRLQVLGLNAHSSESLLRQPGIGHPALGSAFKTNPISPQNLLSPPETSRSRTQPLGEYQPFSPPFEHQQYLPHTNQRQATAFSPPQKPPTAVDLGPSDSLSQMYRPSRLPVESVRSNRTKDTRRGGTNVDPVDGQDYGDEYENHSSWETRHPAPSDAPELEEMTMGRTEWANDTMGGDMLDMRERLISTSHAQQAHDLAAMNQHIADASTLATALTKLEVTQDQLRTLQATLIAERVARSQMERRSHEGEDDVREVKNELAGAVRALRRAKEEARRNEEEKRRLAKCFEETKVQLYKYHEELRVRDARSKGREEGRAEAWQEAERWMGQNPPIPHVDPIQTVPQAVLRTTPMNPYNTLPQHDQQPLQPQHTQQTYQPHQHPGDALAMLQSPPQQLSNSGYNSMGSGQQQQQQQPPHQSLSPPSHFQPPPQHPVQHQPSQQQGGNTISVMLPSLPTQSNQNHTQTVYQPMIIPVPIPQPQQAPQQVPHAQPFQPFPAQPPHTQNIPRSAPHRLNQLPAHSQSQQQHPQRAATVISRTPQNPYATHLASTEPRHPHTQGHQRSATLGTHSFRAPAPPSMPQHNAAESYLNHIDADPHIQQMLRDTTSKTVHTSAFSDRPPTARSVSAPVDKPLPTPLQTPGHSHGQGHTVRQSRSGTLASAKPKSARYSMLDQLHGHPRNESNLNGEDRYPAFPHQKPQGQGQQARSQGGGHGRGGSVDSVNPAGIALPHSTAGSMMNTPQTKVSRRSKVAGAQRGGTEIEDLSDIAEEEREARRSYLANMPQQQQPMNHQQQQQQQQQFQPPPMHQPRQKSGYAPSMPPLRNRPVPRMPQPLGADGKAPSEPHAHRGLANLFHRHTTHQDPAQALDRQAAMFDAMPNVSSTKPKGSHDLYVPPGMAAQAVHGSVLDIQGPRTSALGLEGLDDQAQPRHGASSAGGGGGGGGRRSRAGTMESTKAPTIMIQPPSSQNKSRPETILTALTPHSAKSAKTTSRPLQPKIPSAHPSNLPNPAAPAGPTKRQTLVVTEYYGNPQPQPKTASRTPAAHAIPLPLSQPHAPTVYSGFSSERVLSPPDMHSSGELLPSVSVIDYALRQALPDSRPTTMYSAAPARVVTVVDEPDVDEPSAPRFKLPAKSGKRKPTLTIYGHNTAVVDPRSVPLPASRAPTHRPRTSTYAGTVATIDEVTEEESMRGTRPERRR